MKKKYDWLIVGAGLFGSTFAHLAKKEHKRCFVIDKRNHTGGNVYCEKIDGIIVHKYGAHIFHTSSKEIWDFVNSITPFTPYTHSPMARYKRGLYNLPFNMNTFCRLWGDVTPIQAKEKVECQKIKTDNPKNLEEQALSLVGTDIYNTFIKNYTEKQWGHECAQLPPDIIKRIPLRFTFDNNYFNDIYQGIPNDGYNALIDGLLEGVETMLCVDYLKNRGCFCDIADNILFTGQIDAFFDYKYGSLRYRSIRFEDCELFMDNYQGCAVMNYTDADNLYTRIIEHKHFDRNCKVDNITIISKEYSVEWHKGIEPYYPINDKENNALYAKYKELSHSLPNVFFGGRLGEYKYYDMDDTIEAAISLYKNVK